MASEIPALPVHGSLGLEYLLNRRSDGARAASARTGSATGSSTGPTDGLQMPYIGAATAAQDLQRRHSRAERLILVSQFGGVPGIEIGAGIEFGVTALRGIRAQAPDAGGRKIGVAEQMIEVAGMGAIDHVIHRIAGGEVVVRRIASAKPSPDGSRPSVSTVKESTTGMAWALAARVIPTASSV